MAEHDASAAEIGRRAAEAALGTARHGARRLGEEVREAGASVLAEQKTRLVATIHGFAEALRRAGDTLGQEESPVAARCAAQAAAQLERVAATLRERQFSDILAGAESLARRQPGLFIAGAIAAGFLATRLLVPAAAPAPRRGAAPSGGERAWREGPHPADEPLAGPGWGR